jgi:hypothetical protein
LAVDPKALSVCPLRFVLLVTQVFLGVAAEVASREALVRLHFGSGELWQETGGYRWTRKD